MRTVSFLGSGIGIEIGAGGLCGCGDIHSKGQSVCQFSETHLGIFNEPRHDRLLGVQAVFDLSEDCFRMGFKRRLVNFLASVRW